MSAEQNFMDSLGKTMKDLGRIFAESEVLKEVREELQRQHERWGEQNHPMVTAYPAELYRRTEEMWKRLNEDSVEKGTLGWDGILLEEAYEAFAEEDPEKREAELVQVAAVAVAAIISSRKQRGL